MVVEKEVGKTNDGKIVYLGPRPGEPSKAYFYTKEPGVVSADKILRYPVDVGNIIFTKNADGQEVPHCILCDKDGHYANDCSGSGGYNRS